MRKLAIAAALVVAVGIGCCIPLLAGMVSKSVNVDGHIEQVSCSNGITSVITAINQNTKRVYNYDLSGNLVLTLTISGTN